MVLQAPGARGPQGGLRLAGTLPSEMLTVREVAAQLKVSTATIYKLVKEGELPHVRVGNSIRIPLDREKK